MKTKTNDTENGSILKPLLLAVALLTATVSLTYAMVVTRKGSQDINEAATNVSTKPKADEDDTCPEITDIGAINRKEFNVTSGNMLPMPKLIRHPQFKPGYDGSVHKPVILLFSALKYRNWKPKHPDNNSPNGDYTCECYLTARVKNVDGDERRDCPDFPKDISYGTVTWHILDPAIKIFGPQTLVSTADSNGEMVRLHAVVAPKIYQATGRWSIVSGDAVKIANVDSAWVHVTALKGKASSVTLRYTYTSPTHNVYTEDFNIRVVAPAGTHVLNEGHTTFETGGPYDPYLEKTMEYSVVDVDKSPISEFCSYINEKGGVSSVRTIELLGAEIVDKVKPKRRLRWELKDAYNVPLGKPVVFKDNYKLSSDELEDSQKYYCYGEPWKKKRQATGNLVESQKILVLAGASTQIIIKRLDGTYDQ